MGNDGILLGGTGDIEEEAVEAKARDLMRLLEIGWVLGTISATGSSGLRSCRFLSAWLPTWQTNQPAFAAIPLFSATGRVFAGQSSP